MRARAQVDDGKMNSGMDNITGVSCVKATRRKPKNPLPPLEASPWGASLVRHEIEKDRICCADVPDCLCETAAASFDDGRN